MNPSGGNLIDLNDVKRCLKSFGDFHYKDLVAIKNLLNVDGDDLISKNHFLTSIKNANALYDAQVDTLEEEILMDGDEAGDATRKLKGTANNQIRNADRKAYTRGGRALVDLK